MADNIIYERNLRDIKPITTQQEMADEYVKKLKGVENLLEKDGPLYSTWIYLQIGLSNPLVFNSSSNDPRKNLIASLNFKKTGTGTTNSFTLTIHYDPFNMGQNDAELVEELDERMARAMATDWSDASTAIRGKIQYGYNSTTDVELVSPCYEFYITDISSEIKFDSGITTYKISGCSLIAVDCDFSADFEAVEDKPLMQVVEEVLFKWYGDDNNRPTRIDSTKVSENNQYNYIIDIPDDVYNECVKITEGAVTGENPIQYCLNLMSKYPLTQAEEEDDEYNDLDNLSYAQRPRYVLYITDETERPTIHVAHVKASSRLDKDGNETSTEKNSIVMDYTFTWGLQQTNIVTGWSPSVDLRQYLIQKSLFIRYPRLKAEAEATGNDDLARKYRNKMINIDTEFGEYYDATISTVGVPADPPVGAEITVKPRILNAESRTSGVYTVVSGEDNISTGGDYSSTLNLVRKRSLTGMVKKLTKAQQDEYEQAKLEEAEEDRQKQEQADKEKQARIEYLNSLK